jgi:hypothetical protein
MDSGKTFVDELQQHVASRLASLDLLKDQEPGPAGRDEVIRRLKVALRNELEAAELAAAWIPSTPEIDVKLALARQAGDEARHYHLIEKHLESMDVDLSGFNPAAMAMGLCTIFCGRLTRRWSGLLERISPARRWP